MSKSTNESEPTSQHAARKAKTSTDIRVAAKRAVTRLYETSPPKDLQAVTQHCAMAHGMLILWAELTKDSGSDKAAHADIQSELEALVEGLDAAARTRLNLPVIDLSERTA